MERVEPIKSPYWKPSKGQIVRELDDLFDTEGYASIEEYRATLILTAIKNPDEMKFYMEALQIRTLLVKQVLEESERPEIKQEFNAE